MLYPLSYGSATSARSSACKSSPSLGGVYWQAGGSSHRLGQCAKASEETTGPSTDQGKLIHLSVFFQE